MPCGLVKAGTQAVQEFSEQHPDNWRNRVLFRTANVSRIINIILSNDGIRILQVDTNFPIERIEVHLRPSDLHLYISQAVHSPNTPKGA